MKDTGSFTDLSSTFCKSIFPRFASFDYCCSNCGLAIPQGDKCIYSSGYGSVVDLSSPKVESVFCLGCYRLILGSRELLMHYIKVIDEPKGLSPTELKLWAQYNNPLEKLDLYRHEGGCLLLAEEQPSDRPVVEVQGRKVNIAKIIFLRGDEPLDPGNVIRHICDVPGCLAIEHLEQGTPTENLLDQSDRGRRGDTFKDLDPLQKARKTLELRIENLNSLRE